MKRFMFLALVVSLTGCGSQDIAEPQADCEYSESHSFGYMPPPEAEKDRMYSSEPTLFQQEPDLAKKPAK
jgi:hypothetical protein